MTLATTRTVMLFGRLSLAAAFLSAVLDRFGIWSLAGVASVDWGSMEGFYPAVAALNPWLPANLVPALAWLVTLLEIGLAGCLIAGYRIAEASLVSGALLLVFALAMAAFLGPKLPLNYSVLSASACAFLVYALARQQEVAPSFSQQEARSGDILKSSHG